MFCEKCGNPMDDNSNFCMECGTFIENVSSSSNTITNSVSHVQWWIIVLCTLLFPLIIGVFILLTSGFKPYEIDVVQQVSDNSGDNTSTPVEEISKVKNGIHYTATASSYLNLNNQYFYYPEKVCDNNKNTAWFEGSHGSGIYEWIKLDFKYTYKLSGISIINGWAESDEKYFTESRVKSILIEAENGFSMEAELNDGVLGYQDIYFNEEVISSCIKIIILDTYRGDDDLYTAISEIKVF